MGNLGISWNLAGDSLNQRAVRVRLSQRHKRDIASRADSSIGEEERKVIDHALVNHFHISASDTKELLALAEKEVDHVVSLHDFTRSINDALSREDRVKIVELLWKVAFADGVLDKYEEYFVRKIADLLYVSHKDYIQAKHKASEN